MPAYFVFQNAIKKLFTNKYHNYTIRYNSWNDISCKNADINNLPQEVKSGRKLSIQCMYIIHVLA